MTKNIELNINHNFEISKPKIVSETFSLNNVSTLQKIILSNRIPEALTEETYEKYMHNKLDLFKNLYDLKDVDLAGKLIAQYLDEDSHIALVTDYDCDGINSAIVLYQMLTHVLNKTKNISVIINRRKNGNGFNSFLTSEILELHKHKPINLIITADHGSVNNEQFKTFKEAGIKLVVTDHHQIPADNYPSYADVFINNQRSDSTYSKEVSGCFVAFLTMIAVYKEIYPDAVDDSVFYGITPYVAISTISDVMSMALPINRYIVKTGLNELNSARHKKWSAIKSVIGISGRVLPRDVGFKLAPLINTASRLNCERLAFDMLVNIDPEIVYGKASQLADKSNFRKIVTKNLTKDAMAELLKSKYKNSIVSLIKTDLAVNGIIAANLGTMINKPSVCFIANSHDDNVLSGSCRGIVKSLDVLEILKTIDINHADVLLGYGGHHGAAGCSINNHSLPVFREYFDKYAEEQLKVLPATSTIHIDAVLPDTMLSPTLSKTIESCGPYGKDWDEPIFLSKLRVARIFIQGSMARLTFVKKDKSEIEGIHFFSKHGGITLENIKEILKPGTNVWVAYNSYINCYNETYSNTLSIIDILKAEE